MWLLRCLCLVPGFLAISPLRAQTEATKTLKIAVFAPVYLDSAFNGDMYKLGRNNIPKIILPGLDFYNGVMMAIDSLNADKAPIEVLVYDSKTAASSVENLSTSPEFNEVSLIIASFTTRAEIKPMADFAGEKKIPLISATYPNDGGLTNNPYFVMINPNLSTHIEALYRHLQRNYPLENILVFRRKGNPGNLIQFMLTDMNKKTGGIPLKIKTIELADNFTVKQVTAHLDSNRQNIVVCGALDEAFGLKLTKAFSASKNYHSTIIGMPTWDGIRDIGKDLDITYSTPYNLTRTDKLSQQLTIRYRNKYAGRPSDMFFKGFESMYHFTRLLMKHGSGLIGHLSDRDYKLFADFDILPARSNKESLQPDYLENKKIYFIRRVEGRIKSVS